MLPASFYEDRRKGKSQARYMRDHPARLGEITVETWLGGYRYLLPDERSEATAYNDMLQLGQFRREYGERKMAEINHIEAQAWTLAHPSQVRWLRAAWDTAVIMRVAPVNVWLIVRKPPRTKEKRRPPTDEELAAILDGMLERNAADRVSQWWLSFRNLAEVAAFTGARRGGLIGVARVDVDLERSRMTVTEKGDKTREVVLMGRAQLAIERQILLRRREYWRGPALARAGAPQALWLAPKGGPLRGATVKEQWAKARGDFPHGFHSLKHYCTSWLARQGVSELDIAIQLGHFDSQGRPYRELVERVYDHSGCDHDAALARIETQLQAVVL